MVTQKVLRKQVGKNVRTEKNRYKLAIESMVLLLGGNLEYVAHACRKNVRTKKNGYKLVIESLKQMVTQDMLRKQKRKCVQRKKMDTNWPLRAWYIFQMVFQNVLRTQAGKNVLKKMDTNWLLRAWYLYQMVTQNMLRMQEEKMFLDEK